MTKRRPSCGHTELESDYRDPDTRLPMSRTMRCEGGRLVSRGNGYDSHTDGDMFITSRACPVCDEADRVEAILSTENEETRI